MGDGHKNLGKQAAKARGKRVKPNKVLPVLNPYVRHVVEPANQELASTACTPEPIHNNTDIIEVDQSATT